MEHRHYFRAAAEDGVTCTIYELVETHAHRSSMSGGSSASDGFAELRGENGEVFNRVAKGRYQDLLTKKIFVSDDPGAP